MAAYQHRRKDLRVAKATSTMPWQQTWTPLGVSGTPSTFLNLTMTWFLFEMIQIILDKQCIMHAIHSCTHNNFLHSVDRYLVLTSFQNNQLKYHEQTYGASNQMLILMIPSIKVEQHWPTYHSRLVRRPTGTHRGQVQEILNYILYLLQEGIVTAERTRRKVIKALILSLHQWNIKPTFNFCYKIGFTNYINDGSIGCIWVLSKIFNKIL